MPVDVSTSIDIARPRTQVAEWTMEPRNATAWYKNIKAVSLTDEQPLAVGSKLGFQAHFLGRKLSYTYEVTEFELGRRLVMRTADGPFDMETTYTFEDVQGGGTRALLRNRGEPAGFFRVFAPFMVRAMRRANRHDLQRLKGLLETGTS